MSVVWIYCIANEIVNLLTTFGIIFDISNTILGLTFLAWGNSLSGKILLFFLMFFSPNLFRLDYVANVVSARQGYPNMGISACYGGPLLSKYFCLNGLKEMIVEVRISIREIS